MAAYAKDVIDVAEHVAKKGVKVADEAEKRGMIRGGSGMGAHVANKYHLPIRAAVHADEDHPKKKFTKIPPEGFVKFGHTDSRSKWAYITIIVERENGKLDEICDDLPKKADRSVMLDERGVVVDVKYGTIWQRA